MVAEAAGMNHRGRYTTGRIRSALTHTTLDVFGIVAQLEQCGFSLCSTYMQYPSLWDG